MTSHSIREILHIAYLFTKSDFKTIMIPITIFSQALSTNHSWALLAYQIIWLWLQLLEFCVSNQSMSSSLNEDQANKPYRPIPSKLISVSNARILRWAILLVTVPLSAHLGVLRAGTAASLSTLTHNELGIHQHWLGKIVANVAMYCFAEMGATAIMGNGELSQNQIAAIVGSALIIITTIHAQDFTDVDGDAASGRITFPIAYPVLSRVLLSIFMFTWTLGLVFFSQSSYLGLFALVAVAVVTGTRYILLRTVKDDTKSYRLYWVWFCLAHFALSNLRVPVAPEWATI